MGCCSSSAFFGLSQKMYKTCTCDRLGAKEKHGSFLGRKWGWNAWSPHSVLETPVLLEWATGEWTAASKSRALHLGSTTVWNLFHIGAEWWEPTLSPGKAKVGSQDQAHQSVSLVSLCESRGHASWQVSWTVCFNVILAEQSQNHHIHQVFSWRTSQKDATGEIVSCAGAKGSRIWWRQFLNTNLIDVDSHLCILFNCGLAWPCHLNHLFGPGDSDSSPDLSDHVVPKETLEADEELKMHLLGMNSPFAESGPQCFKFGGFRNLFTLLCRWGRLKPTLPPKWLLCPHGGWAQALWGSCITRWTAQKRSRTLVAIQKENMMRLLSKVNNRVYTLPLQGTVTFGGPTRHCGVGPWNSCPPALMLAATYALIWKINSGKQGTLVVQASWSHHCHWFFGFVASWSCWSLHSAILSKVCHVDTSGNARAVWLGQDLPRPHQSGCCRQGPWGLCCCSLALFAKAFLLPKDPKSTWGAITIGSPWQCPVHSRGILAHDRKAQCFSDSH